jgi:hypothetical protein
VLAVPYEDGIKLRAGNRSMSGWVLAHEPFF